MNRESGLYNYQYNLEYLQSLDYPKQGMDMDTVTYPEGTEFHIMAIVGAGTDSAGEYVVKVGADRNINQSFYDSMAYTLNVVYKMVSEVEAERTIDILVASILDDSYTYAVMKDGFLPIHYCGMMNLHRQGEIVFRDMVYTFIPFIGMEMIKKC